jgi:hypothetical protein
LIGSKSPLFQSLPDGASAKSPALSTIQLGAHRLLPDDEPMAVQFMQPAKADRRYGGVEPVRGSGRDIMAAGSSLIETIQITLPQEP